MLDKGTTLHSWAGIKDGRYVISENVHFLLNSFPFTELPSLLQWLNVCLLCSQHLSMMLCIPLYILSAILLVPLHIYLLRTWLCNFFYPLPIIKLPNIFPTYSYYYIHCYSTLNVTYIQIVPVLLHFKCPFSPIFSCHSILKSLNLFKYMLHLLYISYSAISTVQRLRDNRPDVVDRIQQTDILFIDEISMVSRFIFEKVTFLFNIYYQITN